MRFTSRALGLVWVAGGMMMLGCGGTQKQEASLTTPTASIPEATPPQAPDASASSLEPQPSAAPAPPAQRIVVNIESRSDSKLKGNAKFEQTATGVKVIVDLSDAPPGSHGAHIHQTADCSDKEAKSAGDHFNPTMHEHGLPPHSTRHLGDLGNIEVAKDGKAHLEIEVEGANLKQGDKMSFFERAIIIHEKPDNGGQPAGNAGKRIGCGEIK